MAELKDAHDIRNMILESMARAAFVQWYASEEEEAGRNIPPGEDWMDHAPETSEEAKKWASDTLEVIEQSHQTPAEMLLLRAIRADNGLQDTSGKQYSFERYVDLFGHYLAMEALGHGVSWFDDHEVFDMDIPYRDFYP